MRTFYVNVYVNAWKIILWALILLQIYLGFEPTGFDWSNLTGVAVIWTLYMVGYNALDRELEIKLDQALKAKQNEDA